MKFLTFSTGSKKREPGISGRCSSDPPDAATSLDSIKKRALVIHGLSENMSYFLPQHVRAVTRVANYSGGTLLIHTGTKKSLLDLEVLKPIILRKLKEVIPELLAIEIIVNPQLAKTPIQLERRTLSSESADIIEWLAGVTPGGLSEALMRLISHKSESKEKK